MEKGRNRDRQRHARLTNISVIFTQISLEVHVQRLRPVVQSSEVLAVENLDLAHHVLADVGVRVHDYLAERLLSEELAALGGCARPREGSVEALQQKRLE